MNTVSYADVETSSEGYASRFAGSAGQWLLAVQSRIFIEQLSALWVRSDEKITLLDAGGGHGQIVAALSQSGVLSRCAVTVLGSTQDCQKGILKHLAAGRCTFEQGDLLKLPYPDRSFDVVTSFRFIPHCDQWQQHISELCRIARRAVIVDYPTYQSVNCISPLLFRLKKLLERNTRTYTLFSHREIATAFAASHFKVVERQGEFFWPMVIHRVLKNSSLSTAIEFIFGLTGITNIFGSPMIVRAVPKDSVDE